MAVSADVTASTIGVDGKAPPTLLKAVGSFCQLVPFQADGSAASNAGPNTLVTFPSLREISGVIVQARKIANGSLDDSDNILVTFAGNVLTIAEVDAGDAELHYYSGLAWGPARL